MTTDEHDKPPRIKPRLELGPKVRDLYWCDFPKDAHLPEFWKRRPVIVISTDRSLHGAVTVIPCSSQDQTGNRWAIKLKVTIDGSDSWAICDKPVTVAVSRLSNAKAGRVRLPQDEFTAILELLYRWLPKLQPLSSAQPEQGKTEAEPEPNPAKTIDKSSRCC